MVRYLDSVLALALCPLLALGACAPRLGPSGTVEPVLFAPAADEAKAESCDVVRRAVVNVALNGLITANVSINGRPANLVFDTGAERSILTQAAARRLGVTSNYDFTRSMGGVGGSVATGDARLQSFILGGYALAHPRVLVGNIALADAGEAIDGLLGSDLLSEFDIDLDLPNRRVELFARSDCTSLQPPWRFPYTAITTRRSLTRHPSFDVQIDGGVFNAAVDSGSQRTVLGPRAAARAGVTASLLARDPVALTRGVGAAVETSRIHVFSQMTIAGEVLRNPALMIGNTSLFDTDMLIGLDYLWTHRIYLSLGSARIFIAKSG